MKYIRSLWKLRKKREFFVGALICVLLGILPAALIPARSNLIDAAIDGSARFPFFCIGFLVLMLTHTALFAVQDRLSQHHNINTGRRLDQDRMQKASRIRFPVTETETFHTLWNQSEKASELEAGCYSAWQNILTITVEMTAAIAVIGTYDLWICAGMLVLLVCGVGVHIRVAKGTPEFWGRYMENMRRTNYFAGLLLNREYAAERKIFGWNHEIDRRFSEEFRKALQENKKLGRNRLSADAALEIFSAVYAFAAVLLLMRPLLRGSITIGLFTSAFYAVNRLRSQTGQLCGAVYTMKSQFAQMEAYEKWMSLPEETEKQGNIVSPAPVIAFHNVTFTYPGQNTPVLKNLTFTMEAGKHYALVGENGCGKSTLVKLLAGLYTPDSGEITVGNVPLSTLSAKDRQALFSVVFQDFYRYPLTIRENLSLGQKELLLDDQILPVLQSLDFHPAVMEKGLDADLLLLQKEGSGLSGGEWQKLAIARCALSATPIAILDEPNASLDPVSEARIYRAYETLLADKTTLFISHRLGSVTQADSILVLQEGRILSAGSHRMLMENCPYYRNLFETQRGLYDGI